MTVTVNCWVAEFTAVTLAYDGAVIPPAVVIADTSSVVDTLYYVASRACPLLFENGNSIANGTSDFLT